MLAQGCGHLGVFSKLHQIASMSCLCVGTHQIRPTSRFHKVRHVVGRTLLAVLAATNWILLTACSPSSTLPASLPPPQPLPALSLIQAEQKGYSEGLAAGERIQARRDRAAEAAKEKQTAPQPTGNGASAIPAVAAPLLPAVAPQPPPEFSYSPAGPAIPVAPTPTSACKKLNGPVCD
jgi:hypothetical protein